MIVEFDSSFKKQLSKLTDTNLKKKIAEIIYEVEDAKKLTEISNLKKMKSFKNFYRIKLGNYRLGLELNNNSTVYFVAFTHRKDIYKIFP